MATNSWWPSTCQADSTSSIETCSSAPRQDGHRSLTGTSVTTPSGRAIRLEGVGHLPQVEAAAAAVRATG